MNIRKALSRKALRHLRFIWKQNGSGKTSTSECDLLKIELLKFDLEGKMKQGNSANPQSEFRQRLPAQLAERELEHLELILANYVERSPESSRLPTRYWDMRVAQLDTDYDLVPAQSQRVASLQRRLAQLDAVIENARNEADTPAEADYAQPKRVAA